MKKSETVLKMLLKVPRGKAVSYAELARATKTSPRAIGQIMRSNAEPHKYPCYKVVMSSGEICNYSAKGGKKKKMALLRKSGVRTSKGRVESEYLHKFA